MTFYVKPDDDDDISSSIIGILIYYYAFSNECFCLRGS